MPTAPSLFISHGAPTFALEPGKLGNALRTLGKTLTPPSAILVMSPHWQTRGFALTAHTNPKTIHDFGGFAPELYKLQYPAPGHPILASHIQQQLHTAGIKAELDPERGLDHGTWVPLLHLFPAAHIPVLQLSMPRSLSTHDALALGKTLRPLREENILIIGSGSLTHNLYELYAPTEKPKSYAIEFTNWIREQIHEQNETALCEYRERAPHASRAHPTEEHFLPLLLALGARKEHEPAHIFESDITYGTLSMESYAWGLMPPAIQYTANQLLSR